MNYSGFCGQKTERKANRAKIQVPQAGTRPQAPSHTECVYFYSLGEEYLAIWIQWKFVLFCRQRKVSRSKDCIRTSDGMLNQGSFLFWRFPCWLSGKEFICNAGDLGSIPGSRRSLGEGNGNPLQYSCQGNPMDRRAWQAAVRGVAKSRT